MAPGSLLHTPRPGGAGAEERARARVRELLDRISRLDGEIEALSRDLDAFAREWEGAVGPALAALDQAEALVRRLQRAGDELDRLCAALRRGPPARGARRRPVRPAPRAGTWPPGDEPLPDADEATEGAEGPPAEEEVLPEAAALKRLWRRLARLLHPDLAGSEAERARLQAAMAGVNAAYDAGDLAALELVAERVGAGDDPDLPGEAERLAHLERREASLSAVRQSLEAERLRLLATDTARLRAEAERRRAAGGDLLAESRAAAADDAAHARADALARLARLFAAARELARLRRTAMTSLARRGPTGALRPFDPVAESPLVRRGAALLEARRASAAARELARRLEEQARAQVPWEAALTLLAWLGEAAGTPPEALSSAEGWGEAWEALAAAWPGAPTWPEALARLPRPLALGLREAGGELPFGLHLAAPDLGAGVRIALSREPVAALGRAALAALGPAVRCGRCRKTRRALHLRRTRGVDELHGLVCPACGAALRSYWQYGAPGGLEALAPVALELGLVAEQRLYLGGAALSFEMLPSEREKLTAGGLRERLFALLFGPYRLPVEPRQVALLAGRRALGPRERVPAGRVSVALRGGGLGEGEALELLRSRVEMRFR